MATETKINIDTAVVQADVDEVVSDLNLMLVGLQSAVRDEVGKHIVEGIKKNTRAGLDMNDKRFTPYARATLAIKAKKGQQQSPVNLTDQDVMVRGVRYVKSGFFGFIESAGRPEVTVRHQKGVGRLPIRAWFGVGKKSRLAKTAGALAILQTERVILKNRRDSYSVDGKAAVRDGASVLVVDNI